MTKIKIIVIGVHCTMIDKYLIFIRHYLKIKIWGYIFVHTAHSLLTPKKLTKHLNTYEFKIVTRF